MLMDKYCKPFAEGELIEGKIVIKMVESSVSKRSKPGDFSSDIKRQLVSFELKS